MQGIQLPWKTTTAGLTVFDNTSPYRPIQWLDAASEVSFLYREQDAVLLKILDLMPSMDQSIGNPIVHWIEDTRPEVGTVFNTAAAVGDTYIDLVDPYIATIGSSITVPETMETMTVVDVDYAKANGWVGQSASNSANIQVTRGIGGTSATATTTAMHAIAGPPLMAEQSDVQQGVGFVPTTDMYNFVSVVGESTKMTKMQENATMNGPWGTLPYAMLNTAFRLRQRMGYSLLFEPRRTVATADQGQLYVSGGAAHYIKDNFLDLGPYAANASWQAINDFVEATYEPSASSGNKILLAGEFLFKMLLNYMREINRFSSSDKPYYEEGWGAMTFTITSDGGRTLPVVMDKWGLNTLYGLGSWGFLFDMGNMEGRSYEGLGFQWVQHIEPRKSIMQREDAYLGSYCLVLKHQATHGIIRGGVNPIVSR